MTSELVVYRWTCPICSAEKSSMSAEDKPSIVGQAENALLSHVRTREGSGHGREGTVPEDLADDDAIDYVEVDEDVDIGSGEVPPYA